MAQGRTTKWRMFSALALAALLAAGLATVAPVAPAAADGNEAPGAPFAARSITAGGSHTCAILPSGALKCWGSNQWGQLGQDSTANLGDSAGEMAALPPVNLGAGRTAAAVTAGESHTCALLDNGTVKWWGFGPWGQLGQGSTNVGDQPGEMAALAPVNLGTGRTATAITAGANHTCALLDNATVKCWGQADYGQLGQDSTSYVGQSAGSVAALQAVNLGAGRTATAVSAGGAHTCALLDNGTVKCWGLNSSGQLGQGSTTNVGDGEDLFMSGLAAVNLGAGRTATAVSAGGAHTCALLDDGTVKCWGLNNNGQLGQGSAASLGDGAGEMAALQPINLGAGRTATAIAAGSGSTTNMPHTCAVLDDLTVKCWGAGAFGQLGQGSAASLGDGAGEMAALQPINLGAGRTATAVTAGGSTSGAHTCAVLDDATVKCWGAGSNGRLGQDATANVGSQAGQMAALAPVYLGVPLQVRLTADERQVLPGGVIHYHVTITNNGASALTGVTIADTAGAVCGPVTGPASGLSVTVDCAYTTTGADRPSLANVATVDTDQSAPVASGTLLVLVGPPHTATDVVAGANHTCALLDGGAVKCWGSNGSGQLGQDSTADLGDQPGEMAALPTVNLGAGRTATAVTAGDSHTCALLDDGTVKCWGYGGNGRLGQGSTTNIGDQPGEMAALQPVNLGAGRTATAVSAGDHDTCAVLDDGTVKCWGSGGGGKLGQDSTADLGDQPGEMTALAPVNLGAGRTATAVAGGYDHTCALLDDGTVKCWGFGATGQLGQDSTATLGDQPGEMAALAPLILGAGRTATAIDASYAKTCALLDNGTVKCWGYGGDGGLGQDSIAILGDQPGEMAALAPINLGAGRTATAIAAGGDNGYGHNCALLDNGTMKCWGTGGNGRLGQGSATNLGDEAGEMAALSAVNLGAGRTAAAIGTGNAHTCAVLDDGNVKCWGRGNFGQLGQDSNAQLGDEAGEMAALQSILLGVAAPPPTPALAVVASADETTVAVGDTVHLHVNVENTGGVALTEVTIVDADAPDCEAAPFDLAVAADTTVDCTYVATVGDMPTYSNSASVTSAEVTTAVESNTVEVTVTAAPAPALAVVASADETTVAVGDTIHLHVNVENTGNVALTGVTIADPNAPGCEVAPFDLGVGLDSTVDCTHVATAAEIPTYSNTVSVTSAEITTPVVFDPVEVTVTLPAGAGLVAGTVTETGSAAPLGGAVVAVLDTATYAPVAVVTANGAGQYAVAPPAGTYLVDVIDPSQGHVSGYHGGPTPVVVTDGVTTTADVELVATRGTIAGTVTDTGGPVAGVLAMSVDLASGQPGAGDLTDNSGAYAITGLPAGPRLLELVDLSATHGIEFYDDVPTPAGAQVLDIVGAGTTTADAELASVAGPGAAAHLTGQVTATVGGNLEGVAVLAVRTSDFGLAAAGVTDASGNYDVALDAGDYKLAFYDPSGTHLFEWHDDQPASGLGSAATVTAVDGAPLVTDAALTPTTGVVSGTVTDANTSDPLADVFVAAIATNGAVVGGTTTAADGAYTLTGLPVGDIRIRFIDLTGAHTDEYHDNGADYAGASLVPVAAGSVTPGIAAALASVAGP